MTCTSLGRLGDSAAINRLTSLRGIGRLHVFPGDDVGAHNKLRRLFGIDMQLDHESAQQLVARWQPYAGVVYFHPVARLAVPGRSRDSA
jgi:3-methyladenine DNA glycosylase/8-oxoguanine DNA glycosylase